MGCFHSSRSYDDSSNSKKSCSNNQFFVKNVHCEEISTSERLFGCAVVVASFAAKWPTIHFAKLEPGDFLTRLAAYRTSTRMRPLTMLPSLKPRRDFAIILHLNHNTNKLATGFRFAFPPAARMAGERETEGTAAKQMGRNCFPTAPLFCGKSLARRFCRRSSSS